MDNLFGTRDLYSIVLRATLPMRIGEREFEIGETIARFDSIQITSLNELKTRIFAQGGYLNQRLMMWENTQTGRFSFTKGMFSQRHLAITSNSKMFVQGSGTTKISQQENLASDDDGILRLKYDPLPENMWIYRINGEKIKALQIEGNKVLIPYNNEKVLIEYEFLYLDKATSLLIGNRLLNGYLSLEGRMRLKEESGGPAKTGILTIPKLRIMSDLSMRLGENAPPMVNTFYGEGDPVGERGRESVCSITILEDDIDADSEVSN